MQSVLIQTVLLLSYTLGTDRRFQGEADLSYHNPDRERREIISFHIDRSLVLELRHRH